MLFAGLFISLFDTALFIYGKKQASPTHLFAGVALCASPFVLHSAIALWLAGAAVIGGLWASSKLA